MDNQEMDTLVAKAMSRLSAKQVEPKLIKNWYLTENKNDSFENALNIVGEIEDNGEIIPWQTGIIATADFKEGTATEMGGRNYVLGKVLPAYLAECRKTVPDFADLISQLPKEETENVECADSE